MKKLFILATLFFLAATVFSQQQNVELLGSLNPRPVGYSDIWGYTDSQGNEFALLGVYNGTSIIDITNPAQASEVAFISGPSSTWRDIKTHSHYAYVTTEGTGGGLQIIDLSNLPASATLVNTVTTWFTRSHNLYIDNGFAYVVGANSQAGGGSGMHILDLSNPTNPVRSAYYGTSGYVHDVYVWNDTAYVSSADTYDMVNLTNKNSPQRINQSAALPGIYAHSGWLTEDKRYFIACEEYNERDITIWDLQGGSWNLIVPQWQMPGNSPVHNVFVKGDYAHISYYKDGYVVLDISDPANPQKVGQYDTYPGTSGTYAGAWGCYPYFESGKVIVSDMSTGLYIFNFTLDDPVPVELVSFNYTVSGHYVNLTWETATELNNSGFNVQRSVDNEEWMNIGFIKGNGTTTSNSAYTYSDTNPIKGKAYYRLVQVDYDGTKEILKTVEVDFNAPSAFALNQNFPNPFNPVTKINYSVAGNSQHVQLKVFDVLGKEIAVLVNEEKSSGEYSVDFNAADLPSGIYIAQLKAGSHSSNIKMMLMK